MFVQRWLNSKVVDGGERLELNRLYKRSLNRLYEIVQMRSNFFSGDMDDTEVRTSSVKKYFLGFPKNSHYS